MLNELETLFNELGESQRFNKVRLEFMFNPKLLRYTKDILKEAVLNYTMYSELYDDVEDAIIDAVHIQEVNEQIAKMIRDGRGFDE